MRQFDIKFDNALRTISESKLWHSTWRAQLGVEYQALSWLALRTGYAYENEPMPDNSVDYLVPTNNRRHNISFGAGCRWRNFSLDLAYTLVIIPDRTAHNSQVIGVLPASEFLGRQAQVIVLSLGYKF